MESEPAAGASPSRRFPRGGWDGGSDPVDAPRPRLALVCAAAYGTVGLANLANGVLKSLEAGHFGPLWFSLWIALYCAPLAYGTLRLRSRSQSTPASPAICAPILLHALAGFLGTCALFVGELEARRGSFSEFSLFVAFLGLLLGWVPALSPLLFARRAGFLVLAAVAGPWPWLFLGWMIAQFGNLS